MAYSNLRRNPIDSSLSTRAIVDEEKTVAELFELPGVYGFNLDDRPIAGTVSIVTDNTAATPFTIVLTTPAPGQVFVDFNTQRGMCIFHSDDNGTAVLCTYSGAGSNNTIENAQGMVAAEVASKKETSGGIAGLTLFKINFRNALNTFTSFFTNSNTASRTYTFQNRDGTIADDTDLAGKQATLVSGTNIKTVNGSSLVGSGDLSVGGAPVGAFINHGGRTAPSGYLACDRSSVLRATYQNLFDVRCEAIGTATMTIASPCVVSLTGHGLAIGDGFFFTTTGALPTGVSANVQYFVITAGFGANSFQFSATVGGSAVNSSGSQSGVHTLRWCPDGIADSTHFNLPDGKGLVMVGAGAHGSMTRADGSAYDGGSVGATRNDQVQGHRHSPLSPATNFFSSDGGSGVGYAGGNTMLTQSSTGNPVTDSVNGTPRTGNETRPAEMAVLVCIKY